MFRSWIKCMLFLSSYSVLFAILLVRNFHSENLRLIFETLIIIPNLGLFLFLVVTSKLDSQFVNIRRIENKNSANLNYIVTYILPFCFSLSESRDFLSFMLAMAFIGILYVRSDMIYINPSLNLIGYNLMAGFDEQDNLIIILSQRRLDTANRVRMTMISNRLGVVKK